MPVVAAFLKAVEDMPPQSTRWRGRTENGVEDVTRSLLILVMAISFIKLDHQRIPIPNCESKHFVLVLVLVI